MSGVLYTTSSTQFVDICDGFDMPVGDEARRRESVIWLPNPVPDNFVWFCSNPYGNFYYLGPGPIDNPAYHTGVDLLMVHQEDAHLSVYAAGHGQVIYAQRVPGSSWCNLIVIEHLMADGSKVYTRYAHTENMLVKPGDIVQRGQEISHVGNAFGRFVYHLHFDISLTSRLKVFPPDWPRLSDWHKLSMGHVHQDYTDPYTYINEHRPPLDLTNGITIRVKKPMYVIYPQGLDVYAAANHNSPVKTHLEPGTPVSVWSDPPVNGYVRIAEPVPGYIAAAWVTPTKPNFDLPKQTRWVDTPDSTLNVHSDHSKASSVVGQLVDLTEIHIQLDNLKTLLGGYVQLADGSYVGNWVNDDYLSPFKPERASTSTPVVLVRFVNTPDDALNVRSDHSSTSQVVAIIPDLTEVHVKEIAVDGYQQLADGPYGGKWVNASWLSLTVPTRTPKPVVVVPAPKVPLAYGPHLLVGVGAPSTTYAIIKAMNNIGVLVDQFRKGSKILIHRWYNKEVDNPAAWMNAHGGPQAAAQAWFNMIAGDLAGLSPEIKDCLYLEGPCEAGLSRELMVFEDYRSRVAHANGFLTCTVNLGTAHTTNEMWAWSESLSLLETLKKKGSAIGVHNYGETIVSSNVGSYYWQKDGSWSRPNEEPLPKTLSQADIDSSLLALRCLKDQQIIRAKGYDPLFLCTEGGVDDFEGSVYTPGVKTQGWRSCGGVWAKNGWLNPGLTDGQFFRKQIQWLVDTTKMPTVIYAHGDQNTFNTEGLL